MPNDRASSPETDRQVDAKKFPVSCFDRPETQQELKEASNTTESSPDRQRTNQRVLKQQFLLPINQSTSHGIHQASKLASSAPNFAALVHFINLHIAYDMHSGSPRARPRGRNHICGRWARLTDNRGSCACASRNKTQELSVLAGSGTSEHYTLCHDRRAATQFLIVERPG